MTRPLHVLLYGSLDGGACNYLRFGVYAPLLPAHGVELRAWTSLDLQVPPGFRGSAADALAAGIAAPDLTPLAWADVLVFQRYYYTADVCGACGTVLTPGAEAAHSAAAGHPLVPARDPFVRTLVEFLERDPLVRRRLAVVYETDDDVLRMARWTGAAFTIRAERGLIERVARRADMVIASTPRVAQAMRRLNPTVRIVRNAVDPAWYPAPGPQSGGDPDPGGVRLLFYGVPARMHDYAVCREAVDAASSGEAAVHRIWLGAGDDPVARTAVDETRPYVPGVPAFARALVEAGPDIGLAPIAPDAFSRSRSELHWLEYSLAGAATIASYTPFGGPYDVIRDGVDGLLAGSPREWRAKLERLVASKTLREELAGGARERVLAEYDVRDRAAEWADAYRWAADHAGSRA